MILWHIGAIFSELFWVLRVYIESIDGGGSILDLYVKLTGGGWIILHVISMAIVHLFDSIYVYFTNAINNLSMPFPLSVI